MSNNNMKLGSVELSCSYCGESFRDFPCHAFKRKYCSHACYRQARRDNQIIRFWSRVQKGEGCWLWTGPLDNKGYGLEMDGDKIRLAHRLMYERSRGPIPAGLFVCHHCDNPRCVNPEHLFLGTLQDNVADMVAKGRQLKGERHPMHLRPEIRPTGVRNGMHTHPEARQYGERNHKARLTQAQVLEIRELYATGAYRQADLAARFNVGKSNISAIVRGETWQT